MEYSNSIVTFFRNVLNIHPEDSINLAKVYQEYTFEVNHGKYNEYNIPKCLNKMIWEAPCPICKKVTIWTDDMIFKDGATIWHCLECGHEKNPPNPDPNNPDANIPVQPIRPMSEAK
jgi:Zn ribbon nucleic-acid-binding protein